MSDDRTMSDDERTTLAVDRSTIVINRRDLARFKRDVIAQRVRRMYADATLAAVLVRLQHDLKHDKHLVRDEPQHVDEPQDEKDR